MDPRVRLPHSKDPVKVAREVEEVSSGEYAGNPQTITLAADEGRERNERARSLLPLGMHEFAQC